MAAALNTLAVTLIIWLSPAGAFAQLPGSIEGQVIDETGGVLPGVTVDLHAEAMETTTVTDGDGKYRFEGVPPGPVELSFKLINFTLVRRDFTVQAGQNRSTPPCVCR